MDLKNCFISHDDVFKASKKQLQRYNNDLIIYKSRLDTFFEYFIENVPLKDSNSSDPNWAVYKNMMEEYERVEDLLVSVDYYDRRR